MHDRHNHLSHWDADPVPAGRSGDLRGVLLVIVLHAFEIVLMANLVLFWLAIETAHRGGRL
jgi:hypothetical protein